MPLVVPRCLESGGVTPSRRCACVRRFTPPDCDIVCTQRICLENPILSFGAVGLPCSYTDAFGISIRIQIASSQECRSRNSIFGAQSSRATDFEMKKTDPRSRQKAGPSSRFGSARPNRTTCGSSLLDFRQWPPRTAENESRSIVGAKAGK